MPTMSNTTALLSNRLSGLTIGLSVGEKTFKAAEIFPILPVDEFTKNIAVISSDSMRRAYAAEMADGTEAPEVGLDKTQVEISLATLGLKSSISDSQMRQAAASGIDETEVRTALVNRGVLVRRESKMHDKFFTTGVWGLDASGSSTPSGTSQFLYFNDAACDPVDVISTYASLMAPKLNGQRPNKLCVSPDVHDAIKANPAIKDRLLSTMGQKEGIVSFGLDAYAKLFEVEKYIVLDASKDPTNPGATAAPANIFVNKMLLLYAPDTYSAQDLSPAAGYLAAVDEGGVVAGGSVIRTWTEDRTMATVVEARARVDFVKAVAEAGIYFSSVHS